MVHSNMEVIVAVAAEVDRKEEVLAVVGHNRKAVAAEVVLRKAVVEAAGNFEAVVVRMMKVDIPDTRAVGAGIHNHCLEALAGAWLEAVVADKLAVVVVDTLVIEVVVIGAWAGLWRLPRLA